MAPKAQNPPDVAPDAEPDVTTKAGAEEAVANVLTDLEDGPVTFTRPGVEARDFTVKDGKISTTAEGRDWLLQHVAGITPAAD